MGIEKFAARLTLIAAPPKTLLSNLRRSAMPFFRDEDVPAETPPRSKVQNTCSPSGSMRQSHHLRDRLSIRCPCRLLFLNSKVDRRTAGGKDAR